MSKIVEIISGIYLDYELYKYLLDYWSDSEIEFMFSCIKKPPKRYYVRVNTFLIDRDSLIKIFRDKGFEVYPDEYLPDSIWFPIKGPFKIPSARKVIVVDKFTAESVYMGANVYIPGVIKAKSVQKGDEVNIIAPNGEIIAYGISQISEDELKAKRKGIAVKVIKSIYSAPKVRELPEFEKGFIYDQSLPAQWVSYVLNPMSNEKILDMCAAPGGKLTHIVQLCKGKAKIYAFDRSMNKINELKYHLIRLGMYHIVDIQIHDSRYLDIDFPKLVGRFDKVLLDPPCSTLGVRPKLIEYKTMDMVKSNFEYQIQFLKVAYRLLRKGGVLVYSTCTITPLENEEIIKKAIEFGFEIEFVDIPGKSTGLDKYDWFYMIARFYPHIHDTPGFFIAKLVKKC